MIDKTIEMPNTCGNCGHFSAKDFICDDSLLGLTRNSKQIACGHWVPKKEVKPDAR